MSKKSKRKRKWNRILRYAVVTILPWIVIFIIAKQLEKYNEASDFIKIVNYDAKEHTAPVDHGEFEELQLDFKSPLQITEACVSCHNKRHKEIMSNSHWTWDRARVRTNGDTIRSGKRNVLNNFCVATNTNTWKCSSCHIGYGYKGDDFDFSDYTKVDCLICHDLTGAYEKEPLGSGFPVNKKQVYSDKTYFPPNYKYITANVGSPTRQNCGKCHFFGGGGDNVKHGDLSSDLYYPDKKMDVHMSVGEDGNDMSCVDCHKTENHQMLGKIYSLSSANEGRLLCTECHEGDVHQNGILNRHNNKIACQTCHIPEYAKGIPTKMVWDWSTAGKLDADGHKITEHDAMGNATYKTPKGTFGWATHVEPEYMWFNGTGENMVYGDKIKDTLEILKINELYGSHDDPNSQIIPVKVHRGKQIFDPINKTLIVPHIYGHDSTAYKVGLDWNMASKIGMEKAGLPYSGKYSFISTEMYWPLNHMVSPIEDALKCIDCHAQKGRLASLDTFYMPGRDRSKTLDFLGIFLIFAAVGGVAIHGGIRFMKSKIKLK